MTGCRDDINAAWAVYYGVFRRITRALPLLSRLSLDLVSPTLLGLQDLAVAVPGIYRPGSTPVTIASFDSEVILLFSLACCSLAYCCS
jgi:FKBP12-rapamycin complex-associated protein